MTFDVKLQDSYSRGQLLLRSFFGIFYIAIPHFFVLMFVSIWASILNFIAFWVVLFTGVYPRNFFDFQVKLMQWSVRLNASLLNLTDEYPSIGINGSSTTVTLDIAYLEKLSRGTLLLRTFLGVFYIYIPHGFCLYFRAIAASFVSMLAWWIVLFTGKYPENMFAFVAGTIRWTVRLGAYASFMTDEYPPFSGK